MSAALATLSLGTLRGSIERGVLAFRGIPYAAPPVAALRFEAPAPPAPWGDERDATRFGSVAPQRPDPLVRQLGLYPEGAQAEDCLTLNVWTPATSSRRPVLVWLHGGAFIGGTANVPLYDGARLAGEGDVVVVTVNYRVGALGFLALGPDRTNVGLKDQVAALRFVRREIAAFGGDPANVTVFGESAGAGSLCALLAMPSARGLFRRGIVQSAAPEGVLTAEEGAERAAKLLAKLGLDAGARDALRAVPVAALLDAQDAMNAEGPHAKGMLFMPVVDGAVLPRTPLEAVRAGLAHDVELLVGTTQDEMRLYVLTGLGDRVTDALLPLIVAAQLAGAADPAAEARLRVERAKRELAARGAPVEPADVFFEVQTDLSLRGPSEALAAAHARHGRRTFVYRFGWRSPLASGAVGACHTVDLPFVFGTLDAPGMAELAGSGPEAEALSANVRAAWVAFARTGNPSHPGIGEWPPAPTVFAL
ncbi:MAG TPA: carboxylesterase family protein [Myxococcota bacterium]|nr:carboxylesterase family protein [Myxococcota bacterium]